MTLNEFYNAVARRADTAKTHINAADTRRVISEAFVVLSKMKAPEANAVIAKALASASKKK